MGNVRAALRSIADVVDLSMGLDDELSRALLHIAGEFMHRLVVLVRGHKRAYGLVTGPNGAVSRAAYGGVVMESRAARDRMLLASNDGGTNPERFYLRLGAGDPLHQSGSRTAAFSWTWLVAMRPNRVSRSSTSTVASGALIPLLPSALLPWFACEPALGRRPRADIMAYHVDQAVRKAKLWSSQDVA
ncbi:hypothetical protein HMPREF1624_01896 [Sporothrix schenckii ATCC 58251]|uniref:Uncharacterized protein n=1 Tax=Sporothrix schenckii (strain ATCC 58251 / de Perez 2211183) TaxID=1391915 RepID=U7Q1T4_SPOS1|nr:hypothetical protein HMPREF1624_01896 [Sporothrix schenckii ATCC 58251]